jgi:hypothetical protein
VAWEGGENPAVRAAGFWLGNLHERKQPSKLVLPSHEPLLLSKLACPGGWRFMEKWFSGRAFVAARDARRCSGFARTAIADSAIAAWLAAGKRGAGNIVLPTGATSRVLRAGSIIGTGNVPTAYVTRPSA